MGAVISKCRLVLDTRRPLKDGTFPVKISVPYGKDLLLSTGVSVRQEDWEKEGTYTGPQMKYINSTLNAQVARVSGRVQELRDTGKIHSIEPARLRKILQSEDFERAVTMDGRLTLFKIADRLLSTMKPGSTKSLYALTIRKVRAYTGKDDVYVEDLDYLWLAGFDAAIGGKINARAVHMRNLRHICNFAIDEGYTSFYPFRKFTIRHEETQKLSLTVEQLRAIRDLDCEPWQEEYRDIFMLMFYLLGVNAADIFKAAPDSIRNGRLEYRRSKTGRLYSIKVEPEALAIIRKYRGKKYLISPLERYADYRDYLHHLNDALKTLGMNARAGVKRSGKAIEPDLSSNWARHTWATLAAELDVSDPTISLALGHAVTGHRTTSIYIKRNFNKVDEANRLLIDYLNKKGDDYVSSFQALR